MAFTHGRNFRTRARTRGTSAWYRARPIGALFGQEDATAPGDQGAVSLESGYPAKRGRFLAKLMEVPGWLRRLSQTVEMTRSGETKKEGRSIRGSPLLSGTSGSESPPLLLYDEDHSQARVTTNPRPVRKPAQNVECIRKRPVFLVQDAAGQV